MINVLVTAWVLTELNGGWYIVRSFAAGVGGLEKKLGQAKFLVDTVFRFEYSPSSVWQSWSLTTK